MFQRKETIWNISREVLEATTRDQYYWFGVVKDAIRGGEISWTYKVPV